MCDHSNIDKASKTLIEHSKKQKPFSRLGQSKFTELESSIFIASERMSCRAIAEFLTNNGVSIGSATVNRIIKKLRKQKEDSK